MIYSIDPEASSKITLIVVALFLVVAVSAHVGAQEVESPNTTDTVVINLVEKDYNQILVDAFEGEYIEGALEFAKGVDDFTSALAERVQNNENILKALTLVSADPAVIRRLDTLHLEVLHQKGAIIEHVSNDEFLRMAIVNKYDLYQGGHIDTAIKKFLFSRNRKEIFKIKEDAQRVADELVQISL